MNKPILLAEDNPDDQELALRAFRKSNLSNDIIVVNDGMEALDYLFGRGKFSGEEPPPLPAVALLDLKMPRKTGLEVLQEIRAQERTRFLPVVLLTSSKEEQDIAQGYRLGVNSYVRKPVDFNEFLKAIQQLGLYWLILNEVPEA
ncbi:response regulator [Saccharophagus sp. K07]|jgi:two-component system response regulator|uniref:response regulator n=1 Tax=Saccharophagus sp. K07 TaxID=2283636 RepID=UPI001652403F|nr:response regulator [Saccharophagus sp. K07]MBC6904979.1 response regulator [Saccharophagus sp. K07]